MKKTFLSLIAIAALGLLAGCNPDTRIIKETKYVSFELSKELLTPPMEPEPPSHDLYMRVSPAAQRDLLYFFSTDLQVAVQYCAYNLDGIKKVYDSHKQKVDALNKEAEAKKEVK